MSRTPIVSTSSLYSVLPRSYSRVPFLYNTRTIQAGLAYLTAADKRQPPNTTRPNVFHRRKTTSEFPAEKKSGLKPQRELVHRTKSDPVPLKSDHIQNLIDRESLEPNFDSTLTRGERDVFERIYREIIREIPIEHSDVGDRDIETIDGSLDKYSTLESIFEGTIRGSASGKSRTGLTSRLPNIGGEKNATLLASLKDVKSKLTCNYDKSARLHGSGPALIEKERSVTINKSLQAHWSSKEQIQSDSEMFRKLLATTKSDKDIWDLMKKFVFTKMEAVAREVKQASENFVKMNDHKPIEKPKNESGNPNALEGAVTPVEVPWRQNPTIIKELSVLRVNYASQCAACLNLLRKRFPYSPYLLAVLPEIKSLGPISYVLGVSTELYNELLYVRWMHYRDLSGCADLVSEMLYRSVFPDARTKAVFKDAERTRSLAFDFWNPSKGNTVQPKLLQNQNRQAMSPTAAATWWLLEGVRSGWLKWQAIEAQVEEEEARRKAANVVAQEDDYDEDDEDGYLELRGAYDGKFLDDEPDIRVVMPASSSNAELEHP